MIALYFIGRARDNRGEEISLKSDLELQGEFLASRAEDGQVRFWMQGRDFNYNNDQGQAEFAEPEIKILTAQGIVSVKGKTGNYFRDTRQVRMRDQVEMRFNKYLAQTSELIYDIEGRKCSGGREIAVHGDGLEFKGKGYIFDFRTGQIEILSDIKGRFVKRAI